MSVSSSLSNALSGLTASARRAEVVSSNISNALTEGYGRRELNLSSRSLAGIGAGVRVDGVSRTVDDGILSDRRLADARLGDAETRAGFFRHLESTIGSPDVAGSLNDRFAKFEAALVEAVSRPDSDTRLRNALLAANGLSGQINKISDTIQSSRQTADRTIAQQVTQLNDTLAKVEDLNVSIVKNQAAGRDATALMDHRQRLIDQISEIVPIRKVMREDNKIALFSEGGAVLLDGKPARFSFNPVTAITPDTTLQSSALSGLVLNGMPISTASDESLLAGGALIANFAVRDELSVQAQTQIDAVARDLVERFQSPAVDPTLTATAAGLFTDDGSFFDAANEIGLAQRLNINAAVDPAQGGTVSLLRDGIGATTPGDVGDATLLLKLRAALSEPRVPASGGISTAARSAIGIATDFLSAVGAERQEAEAENSFAQAQASSLRELELRGGVDTDHEMQQLLLIENAYAANARVIQTIDEMINSLLGI